jgi:two-component system, NarL family, nitrate/nitrite response regulator NarL
VSHSAISVIVAADHPLISAGVKEILSADGIYNVVATASTGLRCIDLMQELRPDIAVIDFNISHPGPIGILQESKHARWHTRICFLLEGHLPPNALDTGAKEEAAYINGRFPGELRSTLRAIAMELSTPLASFEGLADTISAPQSWFADRLTIRQKQIVSMLRLGSSNKHIALVLGVSEGTIKVHLHRIYRRFGVANRTELATKSLAGSS